MTARKSTTAQGGKSKTAKKEETMAQTSASQQGSKPADKNAIRPFHVKVPEAELAELRRRIKATKWPERETVTDASQGVQLATTQALALYWATEYDWRKIEAKMNALPHHGDRWTGHSFPSRSFETRKCVAADRYARMARLDHRTDEDHRSTDQSHGVRRERIGRVPRGNTLAAGFRLFR